MKEPCVNCALFTYKTWMLTKGGWVLLPWIIKFPQLIIMAKENLDVSFLQDRMVVVRVKVGIALGMSELTKVVLILKVRWVSPQN